SGARRETAARRRAATLAARAVAPAGQRAGAVAGAGRAYGGHPPRTWPAGRLLLPPRNPQLARSRDPRSRRVSRRTVAGRRHRCLVPADRSVAAALLKAPSRLLDREKALRVSAEDARFVLAGKAQRSDDLQLAIPRVRQVREIGPIENPAGAAAQHLDV